MYPLVASHTSLMNVLAHASSLRRKQRGIYPQGIQSIFHDAADGMGSFSFGTLLTKNWFEILNVLTHIAQKITMLWNVFHRIKHRTLDAH
jgi:hypothetical protein